MYDAIKNDRFWPSLPKGSRPVAAKATVAPQENTSTAGPHSRPWACSGAIHDGDPTTAPVCVSEVPSAAWEIPKSTTLGP